MNTEIKPCPFCGMPPRVEWDNYDFGGHVFCAHPECVVKARVWADYNIDDSANPMPPTLESKQKCVELAIIRWNLRAPDQWQDISTAPRGVAVWLAVRRREGEKWLYGDGMVNRDGVVYDFIWPYKPTHWMPLPEPPDLIVKSFIKIPCDGGDW